MKVLLIDDVRDISDCDLICRTYTMGISALKLLGPWDMALLDHDLGEVKRESDTNDRELNGSRLVDWLEENPQYIPKRVSLVTANPAGRAYMEMVLSKIMNRISRNEWERK